MEVPLLDLKAQYRSIKTEIDQAVQQVLDSQIGVLGPAVQDFEEQVNSMISPARTLGVSSGTDALLLSLMALDVGPGDEVILPSFTFFATAAVVVRVGATPIFVDIDAQTYNIDPNLTEQAITPKTKVIMPVHVFGQCADLTKINTLASKHGLKVVEDAAQALGATQYQIPACALGDIAGISFYPTKNLGACGEAGLVATKDPQLYEKCRILRNQGMEPRYEHHYVGGNFRMDAFQGAILGVKFKHLTDWNERRAAHAHLYNELLTKAEVQTPLKAESNTHTYHQYTIRTKNRDELKAYLAEKDIGSDIYYTIPLPFQPCLKHLGYRQGQFPVTEQACREVLSLPIFPELAYEQIEYVAQTVAEKATPST